MEPIEYADKVYVEMASICTEEEREQAWGFTEIRDLERWFIKGVTAEEAAEALLMAFRNR